LWVETVQWNILVAPVDATPGDIPVIDIGEHLTITTNAALMAPVSLLIWKYLIEWRCNCSRWHAKQSDYGKYGI
jgi:hypothetical protein